MNVKLYTQQATALLYKNTLLFTRKPIVLVIRALLLPIIFTLVFCLLKNIGKITSETAEGIAPDARSIKNITTEKIVFVRNGFDVDPLLNAIRQTATKMIVIDSPNDLNKTCLPALDGATDCFAAIIFNSYNSSIVNYHLVLDDAVWNGRSNYLAHQSPMEDRIWPVQWLIDSHIGGMTESQRPQEQPYYGYFYTYDYGNDYNNTTQEVGGDTNPYFFYLSFFIAPFVFLIFLDPIIHTCAFLTRERELGVMELMSVHGVKRFSLIISNFVTFWLLYLPMMIITGALLAAILFTRVNPGTTILLQILACTAVIATCVFLSTFFRRASFAGPVSALIQFVFAAVTYHYLLQDPSMIPKASKSAITALSCLFPPFNYAMMIADIARTTTQTSTHWSLGMKPQFKITQFPTIEAYLYPIFFVIQTVLYLALAFVAQRYLWDVPKNAEHIPEHENVAIRCEKVGVTYYKRPWFFPFILQKVKTATENVSFKVNTGEVVVLLGPNGSSKTTLLKGIVGVHKFDKGGKFGLGCVPQEIGFCPQNNIIWPELTIREHIKVWNKIKGQTVYSKETGGSVDDIIQECDLVDKSDARAGTLSGGQKRKLQLAIAFIGGSKICCIDEASSGLDPLSRQNIWRIIQKSVSRRTIIMTTHFLDEADILADRILIMSKGQLMVDGAPTLLKADYGNGYDIYDMNNTTNIIHHASSSAEINTKLAELEKSDNNTKYEVGFPTLEQVFLKVANGDVLIPNDEANEANDNNEIHDYRAVQAAPLELDSGRPLNFFQQLLVLFKKRYLVLRHNWLAVVVAVAIPIVISAAIRRGVSDQYLPRTTCALNIQNRDSQIVTDQAEALPDDYFYPSLTKSLYDVYYGYSYGDIALILLGPSSTFETPIGNQTFYNSFQPLIEATSENDDYDYSNDNEASGVHNYFNGSRGYRDTYPDMLAAIKNTSQSEAPDIALWVPENDTAKILAHVGASVDIPYEALAGFNMISNLLKKPSAPRIITLARSFRGIATVQDFLTIPFSIFVTLGFVIAFTSAIIYPTYERAYGSRAMQYSNGVRPLTLWLAYLLFELQIIVLVTVISIALLATGKYTGNWFLYGYLAGTFILFGIATVLGVFLMSLWLSKRAAYPIAAVIHAVLLLFYVLGYILTGVSAAKGSTYAETNAIQSGLGLICPGANLFRAMIITTNTKSILCGKHGNDGAANFSYTLYGGVYLYLILQIVFLALLLMAIEYRWLPSLRFRRSSNIRSADSQVELARVKPASNVQVASKEEIFLNVCGISKSFNKIPAVQDVSFDMESNTILALLGQNGAGKSTVVNMVRGSLRPDSGDIFVKDLSVLTHTVKTRSLTGVCPQDDCVEDMDVSQILMFYAAVKGVQNRAKNVENIIAALNIQEFRHRRVSKLSGGTKRKLSVAIALIGNPPVLLLDEPSTGQDAASKRALWKALRAVSRDRSILLTTHSMEEVEALATSVAIISTHMLASGTTAQLREQYGGYFHVRANVDVNTTTNTNTIASAIRSAFGGEIYNFTEGHEQIKFSIRQSAITFGGVMSRMEAMKTDRVVSAYTINGATLEEVFLKVCGNEN